MAKLNTYSNGGDLGAIGKVIRRSCTHLYGAPIGFIVHRGNKQSAVVYNLPVSGYGALWVLIQMSLLAEDERNRVGRRGEGEYKYIREYLGSFLPQWSMINTQIVDFSADVEIRIVLVVDASVSCNFFKNSSLNFFFWSSIMSIVFLER